MASGGCLVSVKHSAKVQLLATSVESVFYICKQCRYTLPYIEAIPIETFCIYLRNEY